MITKSQIYRNIFNTEFNIGFLIPRKDTCHQCIEYETKRDANRVTGPLQEKYDGHQKYKTETREERGKRKGNQKPEPRLLFVLICRMS